MTKKNWIGISLAIMTVVAIVAIYMAASNGIPEGYVPEGYVIDDGINQASMEALANEAKGIIDGLNVQLAEATKPVEVVYTDGTVVPTDENGAVVVEEKSLLGYLIDELKLNVGTSSKTYSDREVTTLFDGEVDFDGDEYDMEETITLDGIELLANENDFEGNVYATFPEDSVEYTVTFESSLNPLAINEDETLEFMFLGMSYEISSWVDTEVKLTKGKEEKLLVGESLTVGGKEVSLFAIDVDGVQASIMVGDEEKVFEKGDTKTVNGVEIKVERIFESPTASYVKIFVGEDIETTIEHEDEYEEDSAWEYVITNGTIGIKLVERHTEIDLDGDEEFQAIGVGEGLSLPNAYLGIVFNGMAEVDTEGYDFELDEKSGVDYVRIDGNFESGTSDYDRIYVNKSDFQIYDRDFELIHATEIDLADSDSKLVSNGTHLIINDFEVNYALDQTNIGSNDEDYLTDYGITVMNSEDAIEDNEFNILVPEEELEGSISLI